MFEIKNNRIYKDGKPFFYMADTCWSAFTNISMENWNYYVNYRHSQGFNCIQINVLKQWDSSGDELNLYPFPIKKDGNERGAHFTFDYSKINTAYFDAAEEKLAVLKEYGMTPVLVLLWGNYVPGTWESKFTNNNLFPYEELEAYVSYVTKRFQKYEPIYFVSGDSDFPTAETVRYYKKVLETARSNDPDAVYTFHINGESMEIPDELAKEADFFTYQSGHFRPGQHFAWDIPQAMLENGYHKPVINTEPCYEQIAASGQIRFTRRDVRMAAWQSVLSGASAGVAYGAHGVWSWHHFGESFDSFIKKGAGFSLPYDWREALHFPGANDMTFLKHTFCSLFPEGCTADFVLLNNMKEIRCAHDENSYAVYLPTSVELDVSPLGLSRNNYAVKAIDLQTKDVYKMTWKDEYRLNLIPCYEDALVVLKKGTDCY